jgi:predicted nucleic acid-binding protein
MKAFLDTNILVYAYDTSDEARHKIALELIAHILSVENVVISTQILNEFIVVITGKVKNPLSIDDVGEILKRFKNNFEIRVTGVPDITKALSINKEFKFSYWDSLIIASALMTNCDYIRRIYKTGLSSTTVCVSLTPLISHGGGSARVKIAR